MTIQMKAVDILSKVTAKHTRRGERLRLGIEDLMNTGYPLEVEQHDGSHLTFSTFQLFEKWLDTVGTQEIKHA